MSAIKGRSELHRRIVAGALKAAQRMRGTDPRESWATASKCVPMVEPRERRRLLAHADKMRAARLASTREGRAS